MDDEKGCLRTQLLQCQAENQKLKTQLHGLISLVKKAWTGDHSAAIDVALIVGVSPPTLELSSTTDEIVAIPKPAAINNWLKLSIGLINKHYKERQTMIKVNQMMYLHQQEAYIDEQMGDQKLNKKPKLGEVQKRTNCLHAIVEKENEQRKALRKEMKRNELLGDTTFFKYKQKNGSYDFKDKPKTVVQDSKLGICLVVQPNSHRQKQENPIQTSKGRPKSSGLPLGRKVKDCTRTTKKRPKTAQILSRTLTPKTEASPRRSSEGRINQHLDETEKDITLTMQLLQERLGIDMKGMV